MSMISQFLHRNYSEQRILLAGVVLQSGVSHDMEGLRLRRLTSRPVSIRMVTVLQVLNNGLDELIQITLEGLGASRLDVGRSQS
jgi:hypothetical protein